jgi:hypothetical protein
MLSIAYPYGVNPVIQPKKALVAPRYVQKMLQVIRILFWTITASVYGREA